MQRPYPFSSYLSPSSSLHSSPMSPPLSQYPLYQQEHSRGRGYSNSDAPVPPPGYCTLHRVVSVPDLHTRSPIQSLINKFEQDHRRSTTNQLQHRQRLSQYSDSSSTKSREVHLSSAQILHKPLPSDFPKHADSKVRDLVHVFEGREGTASDIWTASERGSTAGKEVDWDMWRLRVAEKSHALAYDRWKALETSNRTGNSNYSGSRSGREVFEEGYRVASTMTPALNGHGFMRRASASLAPPKDSERSPLSMSSGFPRGISPRPLSRSHAQVTHIHTKPPPQISHLLSTKEVASPPLLSRVSSTYDPRTDSLQAVTTTAFAGIQAGNDPRRSPSLPAESKYAYMPMHLRRDLIFPSPNDTHKNRGPAETKLDIDHPYAWKIPKRIAISGASRKPHPRATPSRQRHNPVSIAPHPASSTHPITISSRRSSTMATSPSHPPVPPNSFTSHSSHIPPNGNYYPDTPIPPSLLPGYIPPILEEPLPAFADSDAATIRRRASMDVGSVGTVVPVSAKGLGRWEARREKEREWEVELQRRSVEARMRKSGIGIAGPMSGGKDHDGGSKRSTVHTGGTGMKFGEVEVKVEGAIQRGESEGENKGIWMPVARKAWGTGR